MHYWFIFTLIVVSLTPIEGLSYSSFGKCSYTGDPHLIPFPSSAGQGSNMYFCQKIGWSVLLQNKWVYIAVKSGPTPYVILDYVVFFYDANGDISCVLIGSSGYSTCLSSSSIISITNSGGLSWNHWYPLAQYFNLQITSYSWLGSKRYDIIIRQTFDLIGQSSGLCVKYDCPLEQVLSTLPPMVIQICGIYISAAQQRLIGRVPDTIVKFITIACQNDLSLSFNFKLAQTAAVHLIHASLDQIDGENYQNAVIKAEENIKATFLEADRAAAAAIGQGDSCFEQKMCLTSDDE